MPTSVGRRCLCVSVCSRGCCCAFWPLHSMSTAHSTDPGMDGGEMTKLLREELGWEFKDRKKHKEVSVNISTTEGMVCLRCRKSKSVLRCCCTHLRAGTWSASDGLGGDKAKELFQGESGREPRHVQLGWEIDHKRENRKESSCDVSTTGEMAVLFRGRRSSSMVCCCFPHLLDATSSAAGGIDGDMKMKMLPLQRKLGSELLGQELGGDYNEKKLKVITGGVAAIGEMDRLLFRSSASVVRWCCTLLLQMTSNAANQIEDDETKKILPRKFGEKLGRELGLERGWVPDQERDLEPRWELNARKKHEEISCDISALEEMVHLRLLKTVSVACSCSPHWLNLTLSSADGIKDDQITLTEVTPLREKNHVEISGYITSRDGAAVDTADSLAYTITHPPGHDSVDAVEVAATEPHGAIDEVVAGEAVVLVRDGEFVGEETADLGDDRVVADKVVARETVDFGDDGNPIVLGVLSPAEYTNLVSIVCLHLPLVDADYQ